MNLKQDPLFAEFMRPTSSLISEEGIRLIPADPIWHESIVVAIKESQPDVRHALPWFEWSSPIDVQVSEYLEEVQRLGRGGLSHHWIVVHRDTFVGLIALDHSPHLVIGHWNLGYWIRSAYQGRRFASYAIDSVLTWISAAGGAPTAIEMRVDPLNIAGVATAISAARRWKGHRFEEGDVHVVIGEEFVFHYCWLIPRLPIEASS